MTAAVYTLLAVGALVALAGCAARAWWYARFPAHLRWELYPVPQGVVARAWFTAREILLLHALHESNRRLWYRSFPFHAGLYLMVAGGCALFATAVATVAVGVPAHPAWPALQGVCSALGWTGVALAVGGAVALLLHRLTDAGTRPATTPADLFNLVFFVCALGLLAAGTWLRPAGSPDLLAAVAGALTWDTSLPIPGLLGAGIVACAALVAYVPMTHMAHFIGKYFAYHAVRWDDHLLADHSKLAAAVATQLAYRPTWSASHLGADGQRTWADVASSNPTRPPTP